jgi:hypothetical protein
VTLGRDFAGVVENVGAAVSRHQAARRALQATPILTRAKVGQRFVWRYSKEMQKSPFPGLF